MGFHNQANRCNCGARHSSARRTAMLFDIGASSDGNRPFASSAEDRRVSERRQHSTAIDDRPNRFAAFPVIRRAMRGTSAPWQLGIERSSHAGSNRTLFSSIACAERDFIGRFLTCVVGNAGSDAFRRRTAQVRALRPQRTLADATLAPFGSGACAHSGRSPSWRQYGPRGRG